MPDAPQDSAPTLLERIASGDGSAVKGIIEQYGNLVWSMALRYFRNRADAEDAVQDVFTDLWQSAARFDRKVRSEPVFVTMIAKRRIIDRLRSVTRHPTESLPDQDVPSTVSTDDPSLCAEAEQLRARMGELRGEEQDVLDLSLVHGYSHSQISRKLDMPLGTVKSHMRRGLLKMQSLLGLGNTPGDGS